MQQLGRGLRLSEEKECLTVLDFIGQANRKYNFEDKFAALLAHATRSVSREIKDGFVSVPKGCYIQLEKKAAKYILDNIRASYGNTAGLVARAASCITIILIRGQSISFPLSPVSAPEQMPSKTFPSHWNLY